MDSSSLVIILLCGWATWVVVGSALVLSLMYLFPLETREELLYDKTWLLGGWMRHVAAWVMARDHSPEAVRALAEAVTRSTDERVRDIGLAALRHLGSQSCIDAACAVWAAARHADLTQLLIERGWVASAPLRVRVLSALKAGKLDVVTVGGVDMVEPLLQACKDADADVVEQAQRALRQLQMPETQEALCRMVIERDHPIAREAAVAAQYAPRDAVQQALFYFLTEPKFRTLRIEYQSIGSSKVPSAAGG